MLTAAGPELKQLAAGLVALGCPSEKWSFMAEQLHKRALQLAEEKHRDYEAALQHLLRLMRQGWAAKERGV